MAAKKYQVFVSSTFRDLVDERQDTIRNILDLKHIPAGMELFPAADIEQLSYIKKVIDECDYYLLIVGGRYGSLDADGVSFTEREYDYAVETGKFVIAFVHGEPEGISVKNSDVKREIVEALNAFRDKVKKGRLVRMWTDRQNLENAVIKSLSLAFSDFPQVGWIRGNAAASEQVLESSNRALQENAELRTELAKMKTVPLIEFEDLASLDDKTTVRYTYFYTGRNGSSYPTNSVDLSWRQIFVALASKLTTSKTESIITDAISVAMVELNQPKPRNVNSTDIATIKVQFAALGLITLRVSKTTEGRNAEFLTLTEEGRRIFINDKVVKKGAGS
ncbi:DUF4062 domain-containing protein [Agrobacterium vitis]|uniref:DUF4062 domain-containing protein n=1 Tax=Agrobacterium vitis TaxID=373 RepID=UPI0012E7B541|nr:DUF4062 domain-containing protein [Agrobacterium vitis]MVA71488.1 DUF4062 domain-containing protein [Agrobacterium vitis]